MVIFKNFFGATQSEIMTSALDLANTAASMASNPSDIQRLIDDIHMISSELPSGALLPSDDEAALFDIYLQIEHYLTTSDPIRTFSREDLRRKASKGLLMRLEAYEKQAANHTSLGQSHQTAYNT